VLWQFVGAIFAHIEMMFGETGFGLHIHKSVLLATLGWHLPYDFTATIVS